MPDLHHLDLVVASLDRSLPWYRELLGQLGWEDTGSITGERGERVCYLGPSGGTGRLGLREAQAGTDHDRYRVGLHHVAFAAPSRELVDACAAWLERAGAEVESGPAEYDYAPGYYAVFLRDPDGLKLEVVHVPDA